MSDQFSKQQKLVGIWFIGSIAIFFFLGLAWVLVWSVGCLSAYLFNIRWYLGIALAIAGVAFFFIPPALDASVLEKQIANTRAIEIRTKPIDLTGKTVVFLGRDNAWSETKSACGYVCDAIVRHGGADTVLFGLGQGTSLNRPSGLIDLTRYKFYTYEKPIEGRSPITSTMVPSEITQVDYVIYAGLTPPKDIENELSKRANTYMLYPGEVQIDYQVVAVNDPKAVDLYSSPLFSALRFVRYGMNTPYFPGLLGGKLHSRHWKSLSKEHGWMNDTSFQTLDFLCGPETRDSHKACVTALDENPHYPE